MTFQHSLVPSIDLRHDYVILTVPLIQAVDEIIVQSS